MDKLVLYRLHGCPFCERVVRKLNELDIDYDSVFVDTLHSDRDEIERVSGQRVVPVIVDPNTGVTIDESENIVNYLDARYTDDSQRVEKTATQTGR